MKKKIIYVILSFIFLFIILAGIIKAELCEIRWMGSICGAFFSVAVGLIVKTIEDLTDTQIWQASLRRILRERVVSPTDYIRISFAYLYRIQINGKYLLVKNSRNIEKFQPVGGVYQCDENEKIFLFRKLGIAEDNGMPIDKQSENDYRMRVPARNLKKFVRRFNKTKQRENFENLSREFIEELVNTGIVDRKNFNKIKYQVAGRHLTLNYSDFYQCYELLLADVIILNVTSAQKDELIGLQSKSSSLYYWATEDEIKTRGVVSGSRNQKETITNHSEKILTINNQSLLNIKSVKTGYEVMCRRSVALRGNTAVQANIKNPRK